MAYRPLTNVPVNMFGASGEFLSGGRLYAYVAGSSTPTAMYQDSIGTSAGTSVLLDSRGEPTTFKQIWIDEAVAYRFTLKDSLGVTIWTVDNVTADVSSAALTAALASYLKKDGSVAMTGDLNVNSHKVAAVSDASLDSDAANLGQVKARTGNYSGYYTYATNQSLGTTHYGAFVEFSATATCGFPTPASVAGKRVAIYNSSASGTITLTTPSGLITGTNAVTSLAAGEEIHLVSNGTNWLCDRYIFPITNFSVSAASHSGTSSIIVFNSETYDDTGEISSNRFTAVRPGTYQFTCSCDVSIPNGNYMRLEFLLNGSPLAGTASWYYNSSGGLLYGALSSSASVKMTAGQYIEVSVGGYGAPSRTVSAARFSGVRVK